jgi:hypothetical protein
MKKKQSASIILICFLSIFNSNINANAIQYLIGVQVDTEHSLAVNTLDESTIARDFMAALMDLYLGFPLIQETQIAFGAQTKWKVASIVEGAIQGPYTGWRVLLSVWNWSGGLPQNNDSYRFVFINDAPSNVVTPFMCAKPVSTYISETSTGSANTLTGTTLSRVIAYDIYEFTFEYQWDETTGMLKTFKIIFQSKIILEIGPPQLNLFLPILIGIGAAAIIGIVYIFYRRRSR